MHGSRERKRAELCGFGHCTSCMGCSDYIDCSAIAEKIADERVIGLFRSRQQQRGICPISDKQSRSPQRQSIIGKGFP